MQRKVLAVIDEKILREMRWLHARKHTMKEFLAAISNEITECQAKLMELDSLINRKYGLAGVYFRVDLGTGEVWMPEEKENGEMNFTKIDIIKTLLN